jgi:hypothetical protein
MSGKTDPQAAARREGALARREGALTRREAILRVSALLGGGALIGQSALLASCTTTSMAAREDDGVTRFSNDVHPGTVFTPEEIALLDEIAETILPETSTPGAKAAGVGPFMAHMVLNAYSPTQQAVFRTGLQTFERTAASELGTPFMQATPARRLALIERLDREQYDYMRSGGAAPGAAPHYFRMMKELALLGYFTSEIGVTQAQRYVEAPGRFEPDVPYAPGDRAWAPHA